MESQDAPAAQPRQEMTGAEALVRALEEVGATDIFGMPGGAILPFYDPLFASKKIRHILVRHEQGAGHAAEGYAMVTGRPGVCVATSGPGATNLVTALADAHMDSVPVVAITGQVGSASIGTDAFQEADIVGATMPMVKHSFLVTRPEDVAARVAEAFHIASTGRPGPSCRLDKYVHDGHDLAVAIGTERVKVLVDVVEETSRDGHGDSPSHLPGTQHRLHQSASCSTIAVSERVDRRELGMGDGRVCQRGNIRPAGEAHQVSHSSGQVARERRSKCCRARTETTETTPVRYWPGSAKGKRAISVSCIARIDDSLRSSASSSAAFTAPTFAETVAAF